MSGRKDCRLYGWVARNSRTSGACVSYNLLDAELCSAFRRIRWVEESVRVT